MRLERKASKLPRTPSQKPPNVWRLLQPNDICGLHQCCEYMRYLAAMLAVRTARGCTTAERAFEVLLVS